MTHDDEIDQLKREVEQLRRAKAEADAEAATLAAKTERVEREVEQIAEIHQALLPQEMPEVAGVTLAARHRAPNKAGGDYYDVIPLNRDRDLEAEASDPWLLIIADASGHGPAAAMIMAMIQAVLHGYRGDVEGPGQVMEFVNHEMAQKAVPGSFTTAVLGVLNPKQRSFAYAIAGHHPPLLRRLGEAVVELSSEHAGLPLGVVDDESMGRHVVHPLQPGDAVLLFTDGALEARSAGDEQFGLARLMAAFGAASADATPDEQLATIDAAVAAHRGDGPEEDDQTLVMFQVDG